MRNPSRAVALAVFTAATACVSHVRSADIADIAVTTPPSEDPVFADQRVLLRRFSDARPEEFSRNLPGGGFFHGGSRHEYSPTYVDEGKQGAKVVYHGSLPHALPYLLARSLPGDNVRVADALPDAGATAHWDYVVEGRLLRTRDTFRGGVAWIYLAPLGTPTGIRRYEMAYELSVFAADDPHHPIVTRRYDFDEKAKMGLYWSAKRAQLLPLHGLQTLVARSAEDLVAEVAKHQARRWTSPTPGEPVIEPS